MRGMPGIPIDLVHDCFAAADVVGNVFDVSHRARSGRNVHARDVKTDAVTRLEPVCRGKYLDLIFDDLSRLDRLDCVAYELVEWRPRFGPFFIECAIGGLQPAAS